MLVSKTNKIPDKEITAVLGSVSVKVFEVLTLDPEKDVIRLLERKVEAMGGNALINFSRRRRGLNFKDNYSGTAVIAVDPRPFWEEIYCRHCGKPNKRYYKVCIHCGKDFQIPIRTRPCKNCGHLNGDESKFCSKCGIQLEALVKEKIIYEHLLLSSFIILSTLLFILFIYFYMTNTLPLTINVVILTLGTIVDITIGTVYFKWRRVLSSQSPSRSAPQTGSLKIQEGIKYCIHCGEPNRNTAQICEVCGKAI